MPVIPVLADGAQMPRADELPPDLQDLTRRNAARLDGVSFRSGMTLLLEHLEGTLGVQQDPKTLLSPKGTSGTTTSASFVKWVWSRRRPIAAVALLGATAYGAVEVVSDPCRNVQLNEFTGADLDRERWAVVREDDDLRVEDEALKIKAAQGELTYAEDNARNIALQDAPTGPWEIKAKFAGVFQEAFQQAGVIVYEDDNNFAKAGLMAPKGDQGERMFEFIYEGDGLPRNSRQLDARAVPSDFPSSYYAKIVNDGAMLTAQYSDDGENWTAVGRPVRTAALKDAFERAG